MDLQDIVQHPLFGIISLAVGIVGVVLAVVLYRWGRKDKKPLWSIKNNNLVRGFSKQVPNLDIKYDGQNVETLSVCKIVFWNAGSETIRGDDIADADPLTIAPLNNTKLLDVKLLEDNSKPSRFLISTKPDMTAAFLNFDFVDKDQGVVIQAIHTGASVNDLCVKGTIKGAGAPKQNSLGGSSTVMIVLQIIIVMSAFVVLLVGGIVLGVYISHIFNLGSWATVTLILLGAVASMTAAFFIMIRVGNWNLFRIPKQLRSHI
jgi:hypothetical protein